jgi:RNA polymerase sigma-70 factor, ECF subfamily
MSAPEDDQGTEGSRPRTADIERLYRELGPKLHQFIRRQVPQSSVAADLLQDVFVRLIRAPFVVKSDAEMRGYLYRTATSVIAEHYRVARLRRTAAVIPDEPEAEAARDRHDASHDARLMKSQVERGFGRLPVCDRTLLWLAYVEEMSHAEIGAAVGLGTASVKVMLFRARQRLAAALRAIGVSPEEAM